MSGADSFYDDGSYDEDIWDKVTRVGTIGGLTGASVYASAPVLKRLAKTKQGRMALAAAGLLGAGVAGRASSDPRGTQETINTIRRNLPDEATTNALVGGAAMVGGATMWGRGARKAVKNFKDAGKKAVEYYRDGKGANTLPKPIKSVKDAQRRAIQSGLASGAGGTVLITTGNEYRKKR